MFFLFRIIAILQKKSYNCSVKIIIKTIKLRMEDNILYEEEVQEQPKKRTTTLTVLCILSFIGGIWTIGQASYNYFTFDTTYPKQLEQYETSLEQMSDSGIDSGFFYDSIQNGIVTLEKTSENLNSITFAYLFFALLSLLGVFMMFQLKRTGFYIYTFANLFALLVPLVLIDFKATLMLFYMGLAITVLFIILYAFQLKHMK